MHDLTLIANLCTQIESIALSRKASKVLRVTLEIGNKSEFDPAHFKETFLLYASGSPIFQNAQLEFRKAKRIHEDEMILRDIELDVP